MKVVLLIVAAVVWVFIADFPFALVAVPLEANFE